MWRTEEEVRSEGDASVRRCGPPSKRWLPDQSSARGDGFHNLQEAKAIEINCWMNVRGEGEGESHDKQRFLSHQFAFLFPETGNVG